MKHWVYSNGPFCIDYNQLNSVSQYNITQLVKALALWLMEVQYLIHLNSEMDSAGFSVAQSLVRIMVAVKLREQSRVGIMTHLDSGLVPAVWFWLMIVLLPHELAVAPRNFCNFRWHLGPCLIWNSTHPSNLFVVHKYWKYITETLSSRDRPRRNSKWEMYYYNDE